MQMGEARVSFHAELTATTLRARHRRQHEGRCPKRLPTRLCARSQCVATPADVDVLAAQPATFSKALRSAGGSKRGERS